MKKFLSLLLSIIIAGGTMATTSTFPTFAEETYQCQCSCDDESDDIVRTLDSNVSKYNLRDSLPSSVDLSQSNFFPCIRSQGRIGSCTAWATTYYQFGYQVAKMNSWNAKNDSTKQFSPRWTYNLVNGGEDSGSSLLECYRILSNHGAVRYSQFTPTGIKTSSEYRMWYTNKNDVTEALRYRISDIAYLTFSPSSTSTPITSNTSLYLNNMKYYLNDGYVLSAMTVLASDNNPISVLGSLSSQYDPSLNGQKICIKQNALASGKTKSHCITIVGYDDNISYDLNGDGIIQNYEKGAFKIANSWGTDWNNAGFLWVAYDALNTISNTSVLNSDTRVKFFTDYAYNVIEVDSYSLDLFAEVTISQKYRNAFSVRLASDAISSTSPSSYYKTFLDGYTGKFNFMGNDTGATEATFVFSYDTFCDFNCQRKKYYLNICNGPYVNYPTYVKRITLKDKTGKVVDDDTNTYTLSSPSNLKLYSCNIGLTGDVNNDGRITATDCTLIQKHLSGLITLSAEDLKTADVNASGTVTLDDATMIQYYLSGLIVEFPNGYLTKIS